MKVQDLIEGMVRRKPSKWQDPWLANHMNKVRANRKAAAELKKKEKELEAKSKAIAKAAKPPKLTADQIYGKVEDAISNSFPDGDPIDLLMGFMERNNVTMEMIDRAVNKHTGKRDGMYGYLARMWSGFQADQIHDANVALKSGKEDQLDTNSPFFSVEGGKIVPTDNPWK